MLDSMGANFVLYARARGLRERLVLGRHILKNALLPVVTAFGMSAGHMLAGAVIVENVFAWPGVGRLCVYSNIQQGLPGHSVLRAGHGRNLRDVQPAGGHSLPLSGPPHQAGR